MKSFIFCMLVTLSFWETKAVGDSCLTIFTKNYPDLLKDVLDVTCIASGPGEVEDIKKATAEFKKKYKTILTGQTECLLRKIFEGDTDTADFIASLAKNLAEASLELGMTDQALSLACKAKKCIQQLLEDLAEVTSENLLDKVKCKDGESFDEYVIRKLKECCLKTLGLTEKVENTVIQKILEDNPIKSIVKTLVCEEGCLDKILKALPGLVEKGILGSAVNCEDEESLDEYIKEKIKEHCLENWADDLPTEIVGAIVKKIQNFKGIKDVVKPLLCKIKLPVLK